MLVPPSDYPAVVSMQCLRSKCKCRKKKSMFVVSSGDKVRTSTCVCKETGNLTQTRLLTQNKIGTKHDADIVATYGSYGYGCQYNTMRKVYCFACEEKVEISWFKHASLASHISKIKWFKVRRLDYL